MPAAPPPPTAVDHLARECTTIVGPEHVLRGDADRRFFSQDIARAGAVAACVVVPGTVEELASVVGRATAAGYAVLARGGGASYTGGYVPERDTSVLIDTRRLDRIVEINADDMYVTVECGCTWQGLNDALAAQGLRTPFWGPLSGGVATIGGSLSQNAILWGSARYGVSADSVLGLEVVIADGTVVPTGSGAVRGAKPFFRYYGPDVTGAFLGDTGALGIKVRATLKLMQRPTSVDTASFGFDSLDDMVAAMGAFAREGLVSECFGMDPALQHQRMKRAGLAHDLKALKGVMTSAGGFAAGLKAASRVALAGRRFLDGVDYSVHVGTEGRDAASVASAMDAIRRIAAQFRGREVENTIPKVMRGSPFVSMTSAIGPEGERWLPVHAVLPLSAAAATWTAVTTLLDEHAEACERTGVLVGVLTAVVGATAFVLEPVFYWPAPRTAYYERVLERATLDKFTAFPPNPDGETLVFAMREKLTALFLARGATHFQIGKAYRYREGLNPVTYGIVEALKHAVDPRGLMNPGALGLTAEANA